MEHRHSRRGVRSSRKSTNRRRPTSSSSSRFPAWLSSRSSSSPSSSASDGSSTCGAPSKPSLDLTSPSRTRTCPKFDPPLPSPPLRHELTSCVYCTHRVSLATSQESTLEPRSLRTSSNPPLVLRKAGELLVRSRPPLSPPPDSLSLAHPSFSLLLHFAGSEFPSLHYSTFLLQRLHAIDALLPPVVPSSPASIPAFSPHRIRTLPFFYHPLLNTNLTEPLARIIDKARYSGRELTGEEVEKSVKILWAW